MTQTMKSSLTRGFHKRREINVDVMGLHGELACFAAERLLWARILREPLNVDIAQEFTEQHWLLALWWGEMEAEMGVILYT